MSCIPMSEKEVLQLFLLIKSLFFGSVIVLLFLTISPKMSQILFELLAKGGTVKGLIEEKDLVQAS